MKKFENILGIDNPILHSLKDRGFNIPTEIQEKTIPHILQGKDVLASAETGSGKTLAFAVGLIKNTQVKKGLQGLVLTPTRELAEQISKEIKDFAKIKKLKILEVYGGVAIGPQIKKLETAEIVIGTPGRILDHLYKNSIDLSEINTLVLDEADRMLNMGFIEDVNKIISKCPKQKQTLLFSATLPYSIIQISKKYMDNPIEISTKKQVDPKQLKQVYYDIQPELKFSLLVHLLKNEESKLIMIFCNTRRNVDFLANNLKPLGFNATGIHGGFSQDKRTKTLSQFHSQTTNILIATDVAARGLDIKEVSHIYNYDIPSNKEEYTHRIGRTARAGEKGKVINIVSKRDYDNFRIIEPLEFGIEKLENPYITKISLKWMPKKDFKKTSGRKFSRKDNSNYSRPPRNKNPRRKFNKRTRRN
jgi:ATP-dependent RNA helicase DeaD